MIPLAEECPTMQKYVCPECNITQWIYHSRINPRTYSEDEIEVDEETKSVKIKGE